MKMDQFKNISDGKSSKITKKLTYSRSSWYDKGAGTYRYARMEIG